MPAIPQNIKHVNVSAQYLYVETDYSNVKFYLEKAFKKLKSASNTERAFFKISPFRYGVCWPLIDEDLLAAALLKLGE